MIEAPRIQSILLCDTFIQDENTKKHTLVGIFENFLAREFPMKSSCWLYMVITDGRGQVPFKIVLKNLSTDESVDLVSGAFNLNNPLAGAGVVFPFNPTFKAPGGYSIDVFWQNEQVGGKRFQVIKVTDPQNPVI